MKTTPTEKLIEECEMLEAENDHEGILKTTELFLSENPKDLTALSYRATSLYGLEKYDEALKCIDRVLDIDPDSQRFEGLKITALSKMGRAPDAYGFYRQLNTCNCHKDAVEVLAHALIDEGEYDRALECLDELAETKWLSDYRIIDGYKRIRNHSDIDVSDRIDERYDMAWIDMIKSEDDVCPICEGSNNDQFILCRNCCEEVQMSSQGTHIECDDFRMYFYICDKLSTLKEFLKKHADLMMLHKKMDYLDDMEFKAFIIHLKKIGYIIEASKGYIFDADSMKTFCDDGKYAAPRWLVFPGYSAWTIGWRMGAGEDYCMNEPFRSKEFAELFPKPKNWMFNPWDPKLKNLGKMPFISVPWDGEFTPKYSHAGDDALDVSGFITPDYETDFRIDAYHFHSIEHAILFSKVLSYHKGIDRFKITFEEVKNYPDLTGNNLIQWEYFKYAVCLNATYYAVMQDEDLKRKLLETGDRPLVYVSDDQWGGEENLFGFALMQVRDEVRRLCANEDLIDWKYTEYLKHAYPYINHTRDPNDEQSAEYRVVSSVFTASSRYVRDANLDEELAGKYEIGQILTEKAFVDASSRIGGMVTSHRYLILSQFMADFSRFEDKTNWGIHVAKNGSKFKVLDIFEHDGKTQILLLQLPDGFKGVFDNRTNIEESVIKRERENFKKDIKRDIITDLADEVWLQRVSFPIGMSDEGEFYS